MPDHVHIVTSIPPRIAVAKYIGDIKGYTSRLVSLKFECPFQWQEGYGIFTVSVPNLHIAIEYVERQKEHYAAGTINQSMEQTSDINEVQNSADSV
jgi:REP element-mobilizing transposase RayT